jgi:hypothetical protein
VDPALLATDLGTHIKYHPTTISTIHHYLQSSKTKLPINNTIAKMTTKGSCMCGAVKYEFTGTSASMPLHRLPEMVWLSLHLKRRGPALCIHAPIWKRDAENLGHYWGFGEKYLPPFLLSPLPLTFLSPRRGRSTLTTR